MRLVRATAIGFLLVCMLALGGCKKKKPAVPPPQAEAPPVTQPQPEAQPPAPAASEPNRPQPETTQPEATATPPETTPAPKPKRKPRHVTAKKPPPPAPAAPEKPAPGRTVVNNGGTQPASPQLSPSMPNDQAIHQRLSTAQLLEATDYNLKSVSRALTADEQGMVQMIRSYEDKSRQANKDGDTDLAYRFALKAHQLSDELLKH
jgi:outer membrane biosynthesis protein TonB